VNFGTSRSTEKWDGGSIFYAYFLFKKSIMRSISFPLISLLLYLNFYEHQVCVKCTFCVYKACVLCGNKCRKGVEFVFQCAISTV
jgi:hypothetical protein